MEDDKVAKRLDRFLVSETMIEDDVRIYQWVSWREESDIFHVVLELAPTYVKPPNAFKFNPSWLDEDFVKMVKEQWIPCDGSLRDSTTLYFEHNLEKVKHIAINWALLKRLKEDKALSKVEF